LRLPARLAEMNLQTLDDFTKLSVLEMEAGGTHYSTQNNMICNDVGDTVLYAPKAVGGEYVIPLGIRKIGDNAFANRPNLTKLTIPSYVTEIGNGAFRNCTGIETMVVEGNRNSDLQINTQAFAGCDNLTTVTFCGNSAGKPDNGVTTIGTSAFEGLAKLRNLVFEAGANVIIGNRAFAANEKLMEPVCNEGSVITNIGAEAFAGCTALTELVIPASTTSVGNGAYSGCAGLREVSFAPNGQNVTFGTNVFAGCSKLIKVNLSASISSFDGSVFSGCEALAEIQVDDDSDSFVSYNGALYTKDYEEILFYPRALDGDLTKLHPDLREIGASVFQGNAKITAIEIGKNVVSIGDHAFDNCYNLETVTFEEGAVAMTIGDYAFTKCTKLTGIELPACTTAIGQSAFESAGLTAITIPEGVTILPKNVFKSTKLTTIHIPANVETIADGAFAGATLQSITFAEGTKPLTLGTLENTSSSSGVFYGTKITELNLGDRIAVLGAYAFYGQTSLTKVTMSENSQLTAIGQYAFYGTSKLTSVTLGPNLTTIHRMVFYNSKITSVQIPKSVTLIQYRAFYASTLAKVDFELGGTEPLTIEDQVFYGTQFTEITLPARLETAYKLTSWNNKSSFKNFADIFKSNSKLKDVNVEPGGKYFASIDGVVYEINSDGVADTLLFCPPAKTGELSIPKEVRKVENGAFYNTKLSTIRFEEYEEGDANYGSPLLELGNTTLIHDEQYPSNTYAVFAPASKITVYLPSHLRVLGLQCFYGLKKDSVIVFNQAAHLDSIEDGAFKGCNYLTELSLPAVDRLGVGVFYDCKALTTVSFGADSRFAELSQSTFRNCTALTTFHVPATVTIIGNSAFRGCTALASVTFDENSKLEVIEDSAFWQTVLTEFVMPDTVVAVGDAPFQFCTELKSITLSKRLASVGGTMGLFYGCDALDTIVVPEDSLYFKTIDGVLYDIAETILYFYPRTKDPTGFKIPDTVTTLAARSMNYFPGTVLELPEHLEVIEEYALAYANLINLNIPRNVQVIEQYGCALMPNLETVTFAENSKLERIEKLAFCDNKKLRSINLPDNLSVIGQKAFVNCVSLEEVTLPAALKSLTMHSFSNCPSMTKFVIQEGLEYIESNVLSSETTKNLSLEEITIPSTVREIAINAFYGHDGLKRIYFAGDSRLETVGYMAFYNCTKLESIVLPASLRTITEVSINVQTPTGTYAEMQSNLFEGCVSLRSVDLSNCKELEILPTKMFTGCSGLETLLLPENLQTFHNYAFYGLTALKEITIPASVTDLGGYTFDGCTSLETVTFAEGNPLTQLGTDGIRPEAPAWGVNLFANTPALKTVILPENLTTIGISCFENSGVENIDLPATVRIIAQKAFKNCDNLVDAGLSAELLYLGDEAFYDCDKLETAELTFGLEYLGAYAFAYCEQLLKAYVPASVTSFAGNPFMGCSGVKSFELDPDSTDFVVKDGVMYNKDMTVLLYYPANLTAETFTFPETVSQIAAGAFAGAQLKHFVVPEQILELPDNAFNNAAIETVTFHAGLQSIGDHAFDGCKNLNNVTLLHTIKEVGDYVFANCTGLTNFIFEETPPTVTPTVIGSHFFDGCTGITELILHERMKKIPAYMFANTGIVHAVIPAHITDLFTEGVFYGCKQLETVTFENLKYSANKIGSLYFYGCSKLKEIELPYGINNVFSAKGHSDPNLDPNGSYIFGECTALEKITVYLKSASVSFGSYTFYNCVNLKEINLLKVTKFTQDENGTVTGYEDPTPIKTATLPQPYAFAGCRKLNIMSLINFDSAFLMHNTFAGYPNKTLILTGSIMVMVSMVQDAPFGNAPDLKEIWINPDMITIMGPMFENLASDVNIYFYNHTYDEVKAMAGDDEWFTNADEKAHFYFKDTIPEDVEIPEGVVLPNEEEGTEE